MNTLINASNEEIQRPLELARNLRAQAWTGWAFKGAKALARFAHVPVALAIEAIEVRRRARRRRATIRALSGLSDHTLRDIGLSRDSICSVAIELSASPRPTRPERIVASASSRYRTKDSIAA